MSKKMLINASLESESRLAIVDGTELLELFIERQSHGPHVGDIFLAKIVNVEPSLQAAFVDFGWPKHGFLHASDIHPSCYAKAPQGKGGRDNKPLIQQVMQRGQTVLVQMVKYGVGSKGPAMTTYISIPGRYMVLMPALKRMGVSRKIEDEPTRKKLRAMLEDIVGDKELGVIVRTAGIDRTKTDLKNDLAYLKRLWKNIQQRCSEETGPAAIYQERDLAIRGIRDFYTNDIDEIVTDSPEVQSRVEEFLTTLGTKQRPRVTLHTAMSNLFDHYRIEQEIAKMYSRKVDLPGGGHIVIDQAEALVAIDINSGSFRASKDPEENLYQLNLLAAREIARQIRLRDLGGVIVIDFVDLKSEKRIRAIEQAFADEFKKDKARTKILKMSKFCILQMTRQRMRPSLESSIYRTCPFCDGTGSVKNAETMSLEFFRRLRSQLKGDHAGTLTARLNPDIAAYLLNARRGEIVRFEQSTGYKVIIHADPALPPEGITIQADHQRAAKPSADMETALGDRTAEPLTMEDAEDTAREPGAETATTSEDSEKTLRSKRRRRRRKSKPEPAPAAFAVDQAIVPGDAATASMKEAAELPDDVEAEPTIEVLDAVEDKAEHTDWAAAATRPAPSKGVDISKEASQRPSANANADTQAPAPAAGAKRGLRVVFDSSGIGSDSARNAWAIELEEATRPSATADDGKPVAAKTESGPAAKTATAASPQSAPETKLEAEDAEPVEYTAEGDIVLAETPEEEAENKKLNASRRSRYKKAASK